ncbi:hypothetical protein JNW88_31420, partial [Micromonospora sp. ATA32]|nr:hypothetical protein [Micromonospora sp. ATA32]
LLGEIAVLDDVGPPRRGRAYPAAGATSALLLPALLLLGGLLLWPVLRTLHASVTADGRWVGAPTTGRRWPPPAPARWWAGRCSGRCSCRRW